MEYPKDFSVVLFLFLVVIAGYFVALGRMNAFAFGASIVGAAFAVAVIHNLDSLGSFGMKSAGVEANVQLVRQIREDVFAKAVQVQRLAEQTAAMSAWVVSTANRYVGDNFQEQLLHRRDELRASLTELDIPPERQRTS